MSIIKTRPSRFTIVSREACETLPSDALAVLAYLSGKPDNWEISFSDIANRFGWGEHKIRKAMKALCEGGYASLNTNRDEMGKIRGKRYDVANEPIFTDSPMMEKSQCRENSNIGKIAAYKEERIYNRIDNDKQITEYDGTHAISAPSQQKPKKETPRNVLEHVLSPEDAAAVIEHRQRLRKPLTHRAAKLLANAFSEIDPDKRSEAVDMMIVSGWTGFKSEWFRNRQQQSSCPSSKADMQPSEMLAEHVMRIESDIVGRHGREAFVRWAVACRGYALSHDWKAVLVEIDTIIKAMNGMIVDGRDDILALAIEDLTAGEGGKKLNADIIVRKYNELHALWKGMSEMIYDDDGMPAGFRTVLTDEGKALHKRLQERFGIRLLENGHEGS